jgi:hypothetical protein
MRIRSAGGELIVNVDKVGVAGFWNGVPRRADPRSGNTGNSSQGGSIQLLYFPDAPLLYRPFYGCS